MAHGKRYERLDDMFLPAFSPHDKKTLQLTISYDVACQLRCCLGQLAHPESDETTQSLEDNMPDDNVPELVDVENDDVDEDA
ncbi:hypothetical protein DFH09DRAFT_1336197 [Mycena vulgaris]|nr:hypothetical protein DFH09DRAFT_1336197 [Mycena vulgaris]